MKHWVSLALGLCSLFPTWASSGLGISSWAGWHPGQISRAECPELRSVPLILQWNQLEPEPGNYAFDAFLGEPLRAAHADDLYVTLMIWVGPACPMWLYEEGVPKVYTDRDVNPLGRKMSKEDNRFPYYLSPRYQSRFFALIDAFGQYVSKLPAALQERIVFLQSAEGSTGDGQPYKGDPLEARYAISPTVWNDFRMETWRRYQRNFPGLPILVNSDANEAEQTAWLLDNLDVVSLKHGMFSHGYHVSDNIERLSKFEALESEAKRRGKPVLTRGEMDGELFVMGWSNRNIPQALYWSGMLATHCRLDIWNIPYKALQDKANWPAFSFFNRYAGYKDPATAPAAFCALRDGLDASDFERFPASIYGGKPDQKKSPERYLKIAEAFAQQGARMDDPEKALGGGMINRKRSGSNDVGWGILPSNYSRFLAQIEPGSGDIGLWNIDDSIYGRFARSFDHRNGKTRMRFVPDPAFGARSIEVHITYLDTGRGSWSLGYGSDSARARFQNRDSGQWKTETIAIPEVGFPGTELSLNHASGDDTIFHMVEIERVE